MDFYKVIAVIGALLLLSSYGLQGRKLAGLRALLFGLFAVGFFARALAVPENEALTWIAIAYGVAAAGFGLYFLMTDDPQDKTAAPKPSRSGPAPAAAVLGPVVKREKNA